MYEHWREAERSRPEASMPPRHAPTRALTRTLLLPLVVVALWGPAPAHAQPSDPVVSAYQSLVAPGTPLADRTAAARVLLRADSRDASQPLDSALAAGQAPEVWRAMLLAISSDVADPPDAAALPVLSLMMRVNDDMVDEWADAMGRFGDDKWRKELEKLATDTRGDTAQRIRAILALGRYREKSVAGTLIDLTDIDQPSGIRQSAFKALAVLTGIDWFGGDRTRWADWYNEARRLNDARWHRHLVENFTRRAAEGNARRQELEDRLLESQRALYRTTAPDDRAAVLAYMLGDPLLPIRRLGMDLVQQRLVQGQAFDATLIEALRGRLSDESPDIRERAALRLRDLGDQASADIVATRLADGSEQVAEVIHAGLRLLATMPRATAADRALALLAREDLRADAAGALAAMHHAELLSRKQADKARRQLREALEDDATPAPQEIALLAAIGDTDDWNRIAGWVDHPSPSIRAAAAAAWAASDRSLKVLAERADDAVIQPIVIAAAIRRGKDPATLQALAGNRPKPAQPAEQWEQAIIAIAGRVDPPAVLKAADTLIADEASDRFLAAIYSAAIDQYADSDTTPTAFGQLLLRRAQTRMKQGDAALAAADFERLGPRNPDLDERQRDDRARGLIEAYLLTGDDDAAVKAILALLGDGNGKLRTGASDDPAVQSFLAAVKRHIDADRFEQASTLLADLRSAMPSQMDPATASQISELRIRIERDTIVNGNGAMP